jgi:hypothetical protein
MHGFINGNKYRSYHLLILWPNYLFYPKKKLLANVAVNCRNVLKIIYTEAINSLFIMANVQTIVSICLCSLFNDAFYVS